MLSIYSHFEIKDRNVKNVRFLKCSIIVSEEIKFVIYSPSVNFQSFSVVCDINVCSLDN